ALNFQFAIGQGPGKFRGAIVENISILNDGVTQNLGHGPVALGFFNTGINVTGCNYPYFDDVTINGCEGAGAVVDRSDGDPAYAMQTALVVDDCYDPKLQDCRFWHGQVGVSYQNNARGEDPAAHVQAFQMLGCKLNGFQTGLKFSNNGVVFPHTVITGNEGTYRDVGFDIGDPFKIMLTDNQFSSDGDGTYTRNGGVYYDMWFKHANVVTIVGSGFNTKSDPDRVCIYIDAVTDTGGENTHGGKHFLVAENQFGDPVGGSPFGTNAVKVTAGATDIQIGHNDYAGTFSDLLVNDASGNAVIWNASVSQAQTLVAEVQPVRSGSTPTNAGPIIDLYQNVHAGGGANDTIGALQMSANLEFGETKATFAAITASIQSAVAEALMGILNISIVAGAYLQNVLTLSLSNINMGTTGTTSVTPAVDNAITLGSAAQRWSKTYAVARYFSGGVFDSTGSGSPDGVVTAPVGSTYRNTGGGSMPTFWVKQTGTGNTGWVGK
ncbi:MAG TPA: hypothetical protein VG274_06910, partial [Rhizomicrobium sp.]|nr:hypothetical protein [Rhizomicrobium sp.]